LMQLHPKHQIITAEPDIEETSLECGDEFLILACDGIWDVMTKYVIVMLKFDASKLLCTYSDPIIS
jgi:serine/threonine protein phosphatase PrpC